MAHLIDKSALVAEIKRRRESNAKERYFGRLVEDNYFLDFLDTLEVKEVQEPTASDRGMAEEIIVNLKRVENDYRINLTKQIEWLRNIVKKGKEI
jgi:hypothetical protein